jgi:uncharacterized alpha-E superfamily protein
MRLYDCVKSPHSRLSADDPQQHLDQIRDLEQEILSRMFEEQRGDSLHAILGRTGRAAAQVRDRLSSDMLRVVSQFGSLARVESSAWGYVPAVEALAVLNRSIVTLAALRGIELENMTRGPGWHFLSIGRRTERAIQLIELFRGIIVPLSPGTWSTLEMLLEVFDSSITYRSRYFTALQPAPVLDLLMTDDANPRALVFQLKDLLKRCRRIKKTVAGAEWPVAQQGRIEEFYASLLAADVTALCLPTAGGRREALDLLLASPQAALPEFSDAITHTYFSHAEPGRTN